MLSRQQKSAKNGPERYLIFGPNHILVTLRWDDGRSAGHESVCRRFFFQRNLRWLFLEIETNDELVHQNKSCIS